MVGTVKKPRGVGGKGDERRWWEKYGSVCWVPSPIYPPLQAAAYWARRFIPAPHTSRTQALTKGVEVPPMSQHWTQKWCYDGAETEHPAHPVCAMYRRFRNRGHYRLDPCDFRCTVSRQFRIVVMIASGPMTSAAQ
jgi:hypothetical protein